MSTGLRAGEVLALQVRDIGEDRLHVWHSWSGSDRLKAPKTNEERTVPLIGEVRTALLELARKNPHGMGPTAFIFWSTSMSDRPMDHAFLLDGPVRSPTIGGFNGSQIRAKTGGKEAAS